MKKLTDDQVMEYDAMDVSDHPENTGVKCEFVIATFKELSNAKLSSNGGFDTTDFDEVAKKFPDVEVVIAIELEDTIDYKGNIMHIDGKPVAKGTSAFYALDLDPNHGNDIANLIGCGFDDDYVFTAPNGRTVRYFE